MAKRKPMTEEQREAAKIRLAAARAAKQSKKNLKREIQEELREAPSLEEQVAALAAEVQRLTKLQANNPNLQTPEQKVSASALMEGATIGKRGIHGIQYIYPVEKSHYEDPTDRLYDSPELRRHAMRENFIFTWDVVGVIYESHNVTYSEPRFEVHLFRKLFDEEGVETGKAALVARHYQHEDDLAAKVAADRLGLTDSFDSFEQMMNEMRFWRIKQWLLALFQKPKINTHNKRPIQMVIDGKNTEVFDTESIIGASQGESTASAIQNQVRL